MTALVVYLQNTVYRLKERQEGQTMAEYALILGGIAIVVIARDRVPRRADQRPLPRDRQLGDEPGLVAPASSLRRPIGLSEPVDRPPRLVQQRIRTQMRSSEDGISRR